MKAFLLWCIFLFGVGGFSSPLWAAGTCTLNTNGGINFGNYDPTSGAAATSTGSISFTCTGVGNDTVTLKFSAGSSGSNANRTLELGTESLNYNLYIDTGYTEILGDGTGSSYYYIGCYGRGSGSPCTTTGGVASGTMYSGPVYGQILGGQDVSAGLYTDALTVTVTF